MSDRSKGNTGKKGRANSEYITSQHQSRVIDLRKDSDNKMRRDSLPDYFSKDSQVKGERVVGSRGSGVGIKKGSISNVQTRQASLSNNLDSTSTVRTQKSSITGESNKHLLVAVKEDKKNDKGKGLTGSVGSRQGITAERSHNKIQKTRRVTRSDLLESLISTEADYVDKLDKLIKVFVRPLSEHPLTSKYRYTLFSNIKEIYSIHVSIQSDLEYSDKHDVVGIANILVNHRDSLDVHAEYNYQLPKALQKLEELKSSQPKVYSTIMSGEIPGLRLKSILSGVSDIFGDYKTLLEKLAKLAEKEENDIKHVKKALSSITDMEEHLKVRVADLEIKEKLKKLQTEITSVNWGDSSLVTDYGRLLMSGDVTVRKRSSTVDRARHAILLDRIIIITKPMVNNSYVFDQALELARLNSVDETRGQKVRLEWADGISLLFASDNKLQTSNWYKLISQARNKLHPKEAIDDSHSFGLCTFKELARCDACSLLLKGFYSQGYQCTRTNKQAHLECLEACKKLSRRVSQGRVLTKQEVYLPKSPTDSETNRKCFGGYFGHINPPLTPELSTKSMSNAEIKSILIDTVQSRLTLLKAGVLEGGFRYTSLDLQNVNPTSPGCFVMWESKNKGTQEQIIPRVGYIENMCKQLSFKRQEVKIADIEEVAHQYSGQVQAYPDKLTGEWYVVGYYQEVEDVMSSEDELALSSHRSYSGYHLNPDHDDQVIPVAGHSSAGSRMLKVVSNLSNHRPPLFDDSSHAERRISRGIHQSDTHAIIKKPITAAQQKKTSNRLSQHSAAINVIKSFGSDKK